MGSDMGSDVGSDMGSDVGLNPRDHHRSSYMNWQLSEIKIEHVVCTNTEYTGVLFLHLNISITDVSLFSL